MDDIFEIENGDILIYEMPDSTIQEKPVTIMTSSGKKLYKIDNLIFDEKGLRIKVGDETYSYQAPFNYKGKKEFNSGGQIKIYVDITPERVKTYALQEILSKKKTKIQDNYYKGQGFMYGHTMDFGLALNPPHYSYGPNGGDFAPLLPFAEGKKFSFKKPINFKIDIRGISPEGNISEEISEFEGEFQVEISLGKKIPYEIKEGVNIDSFEFEYLVRDEKKLLPTVLSDGRTVDYPLNKVESRGTGLIANVGFPLIVEFREGEGWFNYKKKPGTKVKLKGAAEKKPPEEFNMSDILSEIEQLEKDIIKELENPKEITEKFEEIAEQPTQETIEKAPEEIIDEPRRPIKNAPEEVSEKPKEEIVEPSPEKIEELKSSSKIATLDELTPKLDVSPWAESIKQVKDILKKQVKSGKDLVKFFESNKQKLLNDPVTRKALLLHMRDGLNIQDDILEPELTCSMEKLVNTPLDFIEGVIQEHMGTKEFKKFKKNLKEAEKQHETMKNQAIEKINAKLEELSEEYFNALIQNDQAFEILMEKFKEQFPDLETIAKDTPKKALDALLDHLIPGKKLASDFIDALEKGKLLAVGASYLISGSKLVQLHNQITELQNKLQLSKEGFLLNPSV
ncbi:MAG: hypothetical protein ACTSO9_19110 [Candidatus Helarchaeota archaeon]